MDYDEDRSQVRTGNGPRVMASLRNLAITILHLAGWSTSPRRYVTTTDDPTNHFKRS